MELSILAVILGFILDLIVGDPHWLYHPIRLVGHLISGLEKILRKVFPKTERGELIAGVFLLILTAGITSGAAWILLYAAGCIHPYVKFALSVLMCYHGRGRRRPAGRHGRPVRPGGGPAGAGHGGAAPD